MLKPFSSACGKNFRIAPPQASVYEVLTDDPAVRKQVDDMIFDFYGEEDPLPAGGSRASTRTGHDLWGNVMDASKKQREPVAFKSLAELKRFIRPGVELKTVSHANHADMVGSDPVW